MILLPLMYCCSVVVFTAHPEYVTNIGQPIVVEEATGKRDHQTVERNFGQDERNWSKCNGVVTSSILCVSVNTVKATSSVIS